MKNLALLHFVMFLILFLTVPSAGYAGDWPCYRHDIQRSGVSEAHFNASLSLAWTFTPTAGPRHAWGDPQPKPIEGQLELPRTRFDDTFHVAVSEGLLFFGSSSDNKLYALDAKSGLLRWSFYTDGPVRLAPSVWRGKVYAGSDDGHVYCLNAADGALLWRFRAAPSPEKILGNGRMISVWPVRTGVLVDNGVAYAGAGVFPSEGLYLYALDAGTGKVLWVNDTYGKGGIGTISPQGYIMASDDKLFLPSGRAMPAAFSRTDGRFLFHRNFNWRSIGLFGGTYSHLSGDLLFNGTEQMLCVTENAGALQFTADIKKVASTDDAIYVLTGKTIAGYRKKSWIDATKKLYALSAQIKSQAGTVNKLKQTVQANTKNKKDNTQAQKKYEDAFNRYNLLIKNRTQLEATIKRDTLFSGACKLDRALLIAKGMAFAGGANTVAGHATDTGKKVWSAQVAGNANGLAAADDRLYVSTDQGKIYCFAKAPTELARHIKPVVTETPFPEDDLTGPVNALAKTIINDSGIRRGYCLIMGNDTARLALALARRTEFMTYLVMPDGEKAEAARTAFTRAGLYGTHVAVFHAAPSALALSGYFADLMLVQGDLLKGPDRLAVDGFYRLLKPCGGTAYVGYPENASLPADFPGQLTDWTSRLRQTIDTLGESRTTTVDAAYHGIKITRGPLPGAGSWTHQYGEPGNTTCSDDTAVKGAIGILWYGLPGPARMPSRHASNASPLAFGGRMFVQGENVIMAHDAYNGLELWERELPGALRTRLTMTASNLASDGEALFVAIGRMALKLDAATGETGQTYSIPQALMASKRYWGYIAAAQGVLVGSVAQSRDLAVGLFALDMATGKTLWTHTGRDIMHTTLCINEGRLFFVDKHTTAAQKEAGLLGIDPKQRIDRHGKPIAPDVRLVVCKNLKTGKTLWETPQYVSDCVKISKGGGELTAMVKDGIFLLCGQPWNGHFWSEFFSGEFSRRSLIALSAEEGYMIWSGRKGYRSRPLIVGDTIIAEPWAHDLKTGAEKMRTHPVTGAESRWQISRPGHHCGCIAACPNALFYRSGVTAYYDLNGDYGTTHFGAQRPGCWINCIPANGLVLMPEASSGCVCPFSIHCTITFQPKTAPRTWGVYSAEGPTLPVKRLAVNFGAPGDRRDRDGNLWLSYPRQGSGRLVYPLSLETALAQGGGFFAGNGDFLNIPGSPAPWMYASGINGLSTLRIPVTAPDKAPGKYDVKLYFKPKEGVTTPGAFSIKVQGKTVSPRFDPARSAGAEKTATVSVRDITLSGKLTIAMTAADAATRPFLNGLEIIRREKLPLGLKVPTVQLNNFTRESRQSLTLLNFTDAPIKGRVRCIAPDGFQVTLPEAERLIPAGATQAISCRIKADKPFPPGNYTVRYQLEGDGRTITEYEGIIRHTGDIGEMVVKASADTYVHKGEVDTNFRSINYLYVDGGSGALRDGDHALSFIRFPLPAIPGKVRSVKLRLRNSVKSHAQSNDSGLIHRLKDGFNPAQTTYRKQPVLGPKIGAVGKVSQGVFALCPLQVDLNGLKKLDLALVPTSLDGSFFDAVESEHPPALVIEYGPSE